MAFPGQRACTRSHPAAALRPCTGPAPATWEPLGSTLLRDEHWGPEDSWEVTWSQDGAFRVLTAPVPFTAGRVFQKVLPLASLPFSSPGVWLSSSDRDWRHISVQNHNVPLPVMGETHPDSFRAHGMLEKTHLLVPSPVDTGGAVPPGKCLVFRGLGLQRSFFLVSLPPFPEAAEPQGRRPENKVAAAATGPAGGLLSGRQQFGLAPMIRL